MNGECNKCGTTYCSCDCGLQFADIPVLAIGIYPECLPPKGTVYLYTRPNNVLYYYDHYGNEYPVRGQSFIETLTMQIEGETETTFNGQDVTTFDVTREKLKVYSIEELDQLFETKQEKLISGENLSTINDWNLLQGGNYEIPMVTVEDNLTSIETENALSANQGRVLKALIDAIDEETDNLLALKVNKTGDTMTGALILNGNPTTVNMATNKQYVDDKIAELEKNALTYKGFISSVEPTSDLREGNLWFQDTLPPHIEPSKTFPWAVKTYTSGAWSSTTTDYTPIAMDLWYDVDNSEGWYYIGSAWERLDFDSSVFNADQFTTLDGKVTLKAGGITNNEIATNAAIDLNKTTFPVGINGEFLYFGSEGKAQWLNSMTQTLLSSGTEIVGRTISPKLLKTNLDTKQNQLVPVNNNVILIPNSNGTVGINALDPETFERRISLKMELDEFDMFFGEDTIIKRVEHINVQTFSMIIDGVETDIPLTTDDVDIEIPKGKVVIFRAIKQLTDPVTYLYIMAQAKRYDLQ